MAPIPIAVRIAWLNDRARRVPGYISRRADRMRSKVSAPPTSRAERPASTAGHRPDGVRAAAHLKAIDRDRAVWRSHLAHLVDDVEPSQAEARELLARGRLLDTEWYLASHGDVASVASADEVLDHYLEVGWKQGLAPNPWVDLDEVAERLGTTAYEPVSVLEALRPMVALDEIQAERERARPAGLPRDDTELRWRDLVTGQLPHETTFVLYRILGNDLPPRHEIGQSERNLRFLLEHEPDLPDCERRYVLNRILDPAKERRLLRILQHYDAEVLHLPFEADAYRHIGWRVSDFRKPGLLYGAPHDALPEVNRARAIDHTFHDKNLYVMHNNGARNAALEDGRQRARWVLPFDGNCFFTASAWDEVRDAVTTAPQRRYLVVPMARVNDNAELLTAQPPGRATEEPQVAFRADAPEFFDPDARYGRRPKVELLRRLGVPGPWEVWPDEPWEDSVRVPSPEAGEYQQAGWVARLASGRPTLEANNRERMISRMVGIRTLLTEADTSMLRDRFRAEDPAFLDVDILSQQRTSGTVAGQPIRHLVAEELRSIEAGPRPDGANVRAVLTRAFPGVLLDDEGAHDEAVERLRTLLTGGSPLTAWQPSDLARMLDLARLLGQCGPLPSELRAGLCDRVAAHRHELLNGKDVGERRRALNATGVWFEVEQLAVASYLGDTEMALESLRRTAGRLHDQFVLLPQRSSRWRRHVARADNLLAWGHLLRAAANWGITLTDAGSTAHERHRQVATAVARRVNLPAPLLLGPNELVASATLPVPVSAAPPFWWVGVVAA